MRLFGFALCATLASAGLAACGDEGNSGSNNPGSTQSADTVKRDKAIEDSVDALCGRYKECNVFGEDQWFSNEEECKVEVKKKLDDLWSAEDCGGGLLEGRLEECKNRAEIIACDQNFIDVGSGWLECRADKVCVGQ